MTYTRTIVTVTDEMKIAFGVGVLILVIAFALVYIPQMKKSSVTTSPATNTIVDLPTLEGTVVSVDQDKLEITIATSSKQTTLKIKPDTVITETLSLTDDKGVEKDMKSREVNIADVKAGTNLMATFAPIIDGVSSGVVAIDFNATQKFSEYNKEQIQLSLNAENIYISVQVVRLDVTNKVLEYKTYIPTGGVSTTTKSVSLIDNIPVYSVDSTQRAKILHARTPATLSDVKADMPVFIMISVKSLIEQKPLAQAIIITNTRI